MEQRMNQRIVGYHLPNYMCEILIHDYTGTFLRMVITQKQNRYDFTYELTGFERCVTSRMSTGQKLRLLESLYEINQINEDHLIPAEKYMLEPALIYWRNGDPSRKNIRLLFYPDIKEEPFMKKWLSIVESVLNSDEPKERQLLDDIRKMLRQGNNPDSLKKLLASKRENSELS